MKYLGALAPPNLYYLDFCIRGVTSWQQPTIQRTLCPSLSILAMTSLKNAGNCMGPVAMILAGVVMGGYNFKELITMKKVYITTLLRLIILPALFVIPVKLLGFGDDVILFTFIAFAMPIGMNTIIYPATYGGDTKTGASMTMVSSVFSVITIPLMYLLLIVL